MKRAEVQSSYFANDQFWAAPVIVGLVRRRRRGVRSRKDHWFEMNPYAQRFINTCAVCGAQGYAPQIDDADFAGNESTVFHRFSREKLQAMLRKYYQPMVLDEAGRCEDCACPVDAAEPKIAPDCGGIT